MLMQLEIENVAVIEKVIIEFSNGLNVLTGETGAGKSIIIDSINAVTGERTSKDIIRRGTDKAKVSAIFSGIGKEAEEVFSELGIEISDDGLVLISRDISSDGRSTFRLNGSVVPMMIIKQISPYLINIHGQHDNQKLFLPNEHLNFIDKFASIESDVEKYRELYKKMCEVKRKLDTLETDDALKEHKIELLTFQIDEIASAQLKPDEEEELLQRRDIIRNSESLSDNVTYIHGLINGDDESDGALNLAKQIASSVTEIADFDNSFSNLSEQANSVVYELEEILSEIREADGKFEFDPEELDEIEERLDLIFRLKKKYGNSIEEVLDKLSSFQSELDSITMGDQNAEVLRKEYDNLYSNCLKSAEDLSIKRIKSSEILCEKIKKELVFLDMPNVNFSVLHNKTELKSNGFDQMEFMISANCGEEMRPMSKIASGGELSRIMLAIKTVLSNSEENATMIFDEIDTGVSGKTARKIGEKMLEISNNKQVFCVTHLAQIASLATNHFLISKSTDNGRTYTTVKRLCNEERIEEIARIMGGEKITESTLNAAKELIINN